jgi:hypothetical protein
VGAFEDAPRDGWDDLSEEGLPDERAPSGRESGGAPMGRPRGEAPAQPVVMVSVVVSGGVLSAPTTTAAPSPSW